MIQQEIKLKNVTSRDKIDIKKRGHRKSVLTILPKFLLNGKNPNQNFSISKKIEINQNNNLNESPNIKKIKKTFLRKYTTVIKENKNNNENIQIKYKNKFNKYKNKNIANITSKKIQSFKQIEKNIYMKFNKQYTKYYFDSIYINDDNENEKMNIYDYYQTNNIISNKKCKLKIVFHEYIKYYNIDENILEYYTFKECHYMLRFLLFFIYSREIYVFDKEEDKKSNKILIFRSFVKTTIERIEKINNFKCSILYQIFLNIKKINLKLIRRESIFDNSNINNIITIRELNYIFGKEIKKEDFISLDVDYSKYLPILMNISNINTNTFLPNCFCFGYRLNMYLHDFLNKRKSTKLLNYFTIQKRIKNTIKKNSSSSKRPSTSRKKIYNKSFYKENIAQSNNFSFSFVTIENLNDKLEEDNYYDYSLYINKTKNVLRRAVNDPEIKDIEIFLNNLDNFNGKTNKKQRSIKFSLDIKDKKEKDVLIDKMVNKKEYKSSSFIFRNIKSKFMNNNVSILKNFVKQSSNLENNSKINNYTDRKFSLQHNNRKTSFEEKKNVYKKNSIKNDSSSIDNKKNLINNINKENPYVIRHYSFKYKKNKHKMLFKKIKNSIYNNNISQSQKNTIVLIPSVNSSTTRSIKYKIKETFNPSKINKNSNIHVHKGSISSLSSREFSKRKSNSSIIKNSSIFNNNNNNEKKKNQKNRKYNFKKIHEFFFEYLRQSDKYDIKNISLENIESINRDPNSKYTIEYKNYFRRRIFRYFPPKYFEANDNVWKNGEFKDSRYKSNYDYNLLINKIQKQIQKNKDKYKNLLQKEINMKQISKSVDIYL